MFNCLIIYNTLYIIYRRIRVIREKGEKDEG
nr:MAG TPA: hypothetical protein [Caudoviricetes sp.]